MSREIKVRFWLTDKQEMTRAYTIDELLTDEHSGSGPHVTLLYTGVPDVAGHEICEGDIIEYRYYVRPSRHGPGGHFVKRTQCQYDKEYGRFIVSPIYASYAWLGYVLGSSPKVIGNIYQTPELLDDSYALTMPDPIPPSPVAPSMRRCSLCHESGHNARTCPKRSSYSTQ